MGPGVISNDRGRAEKRQRGCDDAVFKWPAVFTHTHWSCVHEFDSQVAGCFSQMSSISLLEKHCISWQTGAHLCSSSVGIKGQLLCWMSE